MVTALVIKNAQFSWAHVRTALPCPLHIRSRHVSCFGQRNVTEVTRATSAHRLPHPLPPDAAAGAHAQTDGASVGLDPR